MATWNETAKRFASVTDRLGKPIDEGIFDTVVALNMLGVTTKQSCEGHIGWGAPYPWVSVEEDEHKFLLHKHLCQYYDDRPVKFDRILVFHGNRIRPAGASLETFFSDEEQQHKLIEYQQEMHDFTAFLKARIE